METDFEENQGYYNPMSLLETTMLKVSAMMKSLEEIELLDLPECLKSDIKNYFIISKCTLRRGYAFKIKVH